MKEQKKLTAFERALLCEQQVEQTALEQAFTETNFTKNWEQIEEKLVETESNTTASNPKQLVPVYYLWRVVAAAVIVLLSTWGYHFYTVAELEQLEVVEVDEPQLPVEIEQAEKASFAALNQTIKILQEQDTAQWIVPHTLDALEELDEAYQQMKNELLVTQNGKVLIEEMRANLRLRHQILEQSTRQLERIQQHSKEQVKL